MMTNLKYWVPAALALGFVGCTDDASGDAEGTSAQAPAPSSTGTDGTTTGSPDGGSDTSGDGAACGEADECQVDEDCGTGATCVACFCVDDNSDITCPQGWGPEGAYGDCGNASADVCGGEGLGVGCGLSDYGSVCVFIGCESECDCPQPPAGFDEQVACADAFAVDGGQQCVITCDPEPCPEGMYCDLGVCFNGDGPPGYGECTDSNPCACLVDGQPPENGYCSEECSAASDCPAAPETGGDAPVACGNLTGGSTGTCFLDCSSGQECPDGMVCSLDTFCAWPFPDGYGDCAAQGEAVCLDNETCIESGGESAARVCGAAGCVDPTTDCPSLPDTGDAPVACQDVGGENGDVCVLDCSEGQTCPDGATCIEAGYCAYDVPEFLLEANFEDGVLPEGWVVQDVDGLVPYGTLEFVDQAWTMLDGSGVSDQVEGFWAASTSWYEPAGQADDWLISPPITLGSSATLGWSAYAPDPQFADGYEVYVVPTAVTEFADFVESGDPAPFLALDPGAQPAVEPVFRLDQEEGGSVQTRQVELPASLADTEVRVAFRNNTIDGYMVLLDDIVVFK